PLRRDTSATLDPVWGGRVCFADRMRQRLQPIAGARRRAYQGDRRSRRAGSEPLQARSSTARRERLAFTHWRGAGVVAILFGGRSDPPTDARPPPPRPLNKDL